MIPTNAPGLRAVVEKFLRDNDPEGFGCACEPGRLCGPCMWTKRTEPLRAALATPPIAVNLDALQKLRQRVEGLIPFEQVTYIGSLFDAVRDDGQDFEAEVESLIIPWLDVSAATAGMTPTQRVIAAVETMKAQALATPPVAVQPAYINTPDAAIEAAYHRLNLSSVPHAFRPSIAFEAGWRAALASSPAVPPDPAERWQAGYQQATWDAQDRAAPKPDLVHPATTALEVHATLSESDPLPLNQLCLPNGVMFDALGEPRTRYVRVTLDGSHCVMHPSEGDSYLDDAKQNGDESSYVLADVFLSEREFDDLPEFDGF